MSTIWIVEDDDNIRELVMYALTSAGFKTTGFSESQTFFVSVSETQPDLLLLDILLPGDDGIQILKKLKSSSKTSKLPVIMLTAKSAEYDRITGLDLGADDYIAKPFSVMEVISRVKAVLRRSGIPESAPELVVRNVILNVDRRNVYTDDREVVLTFKEFELLRYLMLNEGIVLSRDKLLTQIWEFDYAGESRTVDMHIKSLRQKLGESGKLIKTVRGVGYKMEDKL